MFKVKFVSRNQVVEMTETELAETFANELNLWLLRMTNLRSINVNSPVHGKVIINKM